MYSPPVVQIEKSIDKHAKWPKLQKMPRKKRKLPKLAKGEERTPSFSECLLFSFSNEAYSLGLCKLGTVNPKKCNIFSKLFSTIFVNSVFKGD